MKKGGRKGEKYHGAGKYLFAEEKKMGKEIFGHGRQRTEKETEENIMEKEKLLRTDRWTKGMKEGSNIDGSI